jgi:hypothetical protein
VTTQDIVGFGGPKDDEEDTGTYTLVLHGGRFLWHQRGSAVIFNPIGLGAYVGSGDGVRFDVEQPYYNAVSLSSLTWRMDGASVVFSLPRCTGPAATDPIFCSIQKALFTAHPWERVAETSGGPF